MLEGGRFVITRRESRTSLTSNVEYAPDGADLSDEKLGLRLERAKGLRELLIIDHVEKPSEN